MEPKKLFCATIVFYEGAENQYELTISARKIVPISSSNIKTFENKSVEKKSSVIHSLPKNDRACKGGCRCVSFYNLHPYTSEKDIINLCNDFGTVVDNVKCLWDTYGRKSLFVWMKNQQEASVIIKEYNGAQLDGRTLKVVKGHFQQTKKMVSKLDQELIPERKYKSKDMVSKGRIEKMDSEIDEYMRAGTSK